MLLSISVAKILRSTVTRIARAIKDLKRGSIEAVANTRCIMCREDIHSQVQPVYAFIPQISKSCVLHSVKLYYFTEDLVSVVDFSINFMHLKTYPGTPAEVTAGDYIIPGYDQQIVAYHRFSGTEGCIDWPMNRVYEDFQNCFGWYAILNDAHRVRCYVTFEIEEI